ncbi:hypothetical protein GGU10DRAFT_355559 [Lentinula aff. detonsa]|uniref:Assembly factor CBP4 n=1 Tax=Lentinula aff. detonsa TaxID=2804958 RepID=A0AA38KG61_9AGAR|nr:hypothetical protein GGU10DRAFT_355559 [Lentinula aff. detonsa]
MSHFPWLRFAGAAITFTGLGYMLMKATVPTEEELYNRMAPDIRKKVDAARALRLAREAEMKQQVAAQAPPTNVVDSDSIKPIWADTNPKK